MQRQTSHAASSGETRFSDYQEKSQPPDVILATALVKVVNVFGQNETLRALIDPGSQDSFITSSAVQALGLTKRSANVKVSGIGGAAASKISSQVDLHFTPHYPSKQQFHTTALVMPNISARLPERHIQLDTLPRFPNNIIMADPAFN